MTREDYTWQITCNENKIWDLQQRINSNNNKIHELDEMEIKTGVINQHLANATQNSTQKCNQAPGRFSVKGLFLSGNFLSGPLAVLKGQEKNAAFSGVLSLRGKVKAERTRLENENIALQKEIRRLKGDNTFYRGKIREIDNAEAGAQNE